MIIEYTNAKEPKTHTRLSVVIVVASCAFFFIPTTLIILGYLASRPTGTLISPLPQGSLSENLVNPTPSPIAATPIVATPTPEILNQPIIAAPNDPTATPEANISQVAGSNIIDRTASVSAGLTEVPVTDPDIKSASQIYFSPRQGDASIYSLKSKGEGVMTIQVDKPSDVLRYIDYHIVNP